MITHSIVNSFELRAPEKIPSVNELWKPRIVKMGRKVFPGIYKDPKAKQFQDEIIRQAKSTSLSDLAHIDFDYINVTFLFLLDKNFYRRDVSNMIKMTEDALMAVTKIDDSKHRQVIALKALSHIPNKEFIVSIYEFIKNENEQSISQEDV